MSQAGYTPISLYYSTTASAAPSAGNLANGELGLNITDGKLFYKDNGGVVQVLATKGTGPIGGSTTQVQYNNAGSLAGSANLTFDGTTLTMGANPVLSGGTANGVAYLNGSKVLTTGSALQFDGTNLGLGVTPSAWYSTLKAIDNNTIGAWACNTNTVNFLNNGYLNAAGNWTYKTTAAATNYEQWNGRHAWYTAASGTAGNAISFTQAMTLDSSGNLLVGATAIPSSTVSGVVIRNTAVGPSQFSVGTYTGAAAMVYFINGNGTVGSINTNGTATTYVTSSDYRLKDNPQPMIGALATIAQLKPCTYTWKADGSVGQGFIAHELQEVVPECVVGEKDAVDADGNPVYQGIDTSFLVATLTAAIQEQQAIITQLQADVAALKGQA